jgi:hypothetical protein
LTIRLFTMFVDTPTDVFGGSVTAIAADAEQTVAGSPSEERPWGTDNGTHRATGLRSPFQRRHPKPTTEEMIE